MIGVDATVLTLLLNNKADSPPDPATGKPVNRVRERIEFLVMTLHEAKQKIVIPTPVLGEVLVRAGSAGLKYVEILQKAAVFEIRPFPFDLETQLDGLAHANHQLVERFRLCMTARQGRNAGDKVAFRIALHDDIELLAHRYLHTSSVGVQHMPCSYGDGPACHPGIYSGIQRATSGVRG